MNDEKHYNTLTNYYLYKFGKKCIKISLNAGFSCPNKDGTKGVGGCIFCSKLGSGDFAGKPTDDIKTQFLNVKKVMDKKWSNAYYIPYFQANTNTYAPLEKLKPLFEEAITLDPLVKMISIATRADCLEDDKVKYLGKLNKRIPVQVELGLQSVNPITNKFINRGDTLDEFIDAVNRLRRENIEVVCHIINGFPNETKEDMLNTIKFINKLDIQGIKIHSLCVIKGTKLAELYEEKPFKILTLKEYVDIVTEQIALLKPSVIIHRLSADSSISDLIEPKWTIKKMVVMNEIDKNLRKLNLYQGDHYSHFS